MSLKQTLKNIVGHVGAFALKASFKRLGWRVDSQSHYLGGNRILTCTNLGFKLVLDTEDLSLTPVILTTGEWETGTAALLSRVVKPGMTVVEIGANIGFYTVYCAQLVGEKGKVLSFEIDSTSFVFLKDNVNLNGIADVVTTFNLGISDRKGTVKFHKLHSHKGSSSILKIPEQFVERHHDTVTVREVQVSTLDEIVRQNSIPHIDIIKMDAEGSEFFIFDGMKEVIRTNPNLAIVCEYNAEILLHNTISVDMFFDKVKELGLEAWQMQGGRLEKLEKHSLGTRTVVDLYLKKK